MSTKRILPAILVLLPLVIAGAHTYRYRYIFQGNASGRILIFIPFRVYYEISAAVDFTAETASDGRMRLVSVSTPHPAYLLRTLGFSGRSAILVTADNDVIRAQRFADEKKAEWRRGFPRYAGRVKNVWHVPRRVLGLEKGLVRFERTPQGMHQQVTAEVRTEPFSRSGWHGYYFYVFTLLAETLKLYNHPVPQPYPAKAGLPAPMLGESPPLDFTANLSRVGRLMEKMIADLVEVRQKSLFRLVYRLEGETGDEWLIAGGAAPRVPIWKGFKIMDCTRKIRIRRRDRLLLVDEMYLNLRTDKGQGGYGKMELMLIE